MRNGTKVIVNLTDGSTLAGTIARCWRWRTIRLNDVEAPGHALSGHLLVPHRSILTVQVVG